MFCKVNVAMAQAVSYQPLKVEAQVHIQVIPCYVVDKAVKFAECLYHAV
jgi:hypothetical protein